MYKKNVFPKGKGFQTEVHRPSSTNDNIGESAL